MPEIQGRERDFVLAPNEFVFIQDQTKGQISVYVGPHKSTLAATDSPIIFDREKRKFVQVELQRAIQQFPAADEGYYIVLDNPAEGNNHPNLGTANGLAQLKAGRKINIPGPQTFPLWPGQVAQVVEGHRLRTNQYLLVRVYNNEEAIKNEAVIQKAETKTDDTGTGGTPNPENKEQKEATEQKAAPQPQAEKPTQLTMGKLMVIKGNEVSFYIPPTGIEVVPDGKEYVREAVTLERLEYCVLLSETGNKRYVKGPAVVFPEPTENFVTTANDGRKFKAIELNDDMGLFVKVTADYEEGEGDFKKVFKAGDELFITGREQRLYYPRAEHSIIKYGNREIHYGVAIPEGEARYVLDKRTGKFELVRGPKIFLPDPRTDLIIRRVLSDDEVNLWYPGNKKAQDYNTRLRQAMDESGTVTDAAARSAFGTTTRRADRNISSESAVSAFAGDEFDRGTKYTPPRTVTMDTKYDGAVAIGVWNGYAILVVDKEGNQRVEVGPKTVLLEYDETLQVLSLSTGKPKTTDKLEKTVYLRVSFNQVSDIVDVVTRDMVGAKIKLSYRVNFTGEPEKWFSVENYVKFMTDHARSLLRNAAKKLTIEQLNEHYIDVVRDTILGEQTDGKRKGRLFEENGSHIYDVEVLNLEIGDPNIGRMLSDMQQSAVRQTLEVAARERELAATRRTEDVKRQIADEKEETEKHSQRIERDRLDREREILEETLSLKQAGENVADISHNARLAREKANASQELALNESRLVMRLKEMEAETKAVVDKANVITPALISALQVAGDKVLASALTESVSPVALLSNSSIVETIGKLLKDTGVGNTAVQTIAAVGAATAAARAIQPVKEATK